MTKKYDEDFKARLLECAKLDKETGIITFTGMYAVNHLNMCYGGTTVSAPYSHVVWFLTYGVWPKRGYHIDHINDDPFDNRPDNLQEITEQENQRKRRGRIVYRSYGKGKLGYGINIHHDKRDGRYYVTRHLSRGQIGGIRSVKGSIGGFDTLEDAENRVDSLIEEIKIYGDDYLPNQPKKQKRKTLEIDLKLDEIKRMRSLGMSVQAIADELGFKHGAVYSRVRLIDLEPKKRIRIRLTNEEMNRKVGG